MQASLHQKALLEPLCTAQMGFTKDDVESAMGKLFVDDIRCQLSCPVEMMEGVEALYEEAWMSQ